MKSEDFTDDHRRDLLGLAATSGPANLEYNVMDGWNACGGEGRAFRTLAVPSLVLELNSALAMPPITVRIRASGTTLFTVAMLLCIQPTLGQTPDWIWARSSGAVSNDYSNAVCTDLDGNVYITGTFQGSTITFGSYVLQNSSEGFLDFFIVKYDVQGNVIWAVSDGGTKDDYAYGICVDPAGNVFITGYFNSPSLDIGPSTLVNISTSVNAPDVFVAKYDPDGTSVWGKSGDAGPTQDYARAYGIGSDASGNIYITGHYGYGSVSFDGNTLQGYGGLDMFLVKYDTDGDVLWANRMGGNQTDGAQAIHVDSNGNSYITGWFINSADFGGVSLISTNNAYMEIFVAKYDSNGNIVWANYALVPYFGNYASGTGITADQLGNVYLTGYYQYSLSFGNDTLANAGNHGLFLAKYDSDGNPLWGRSPGGTGTDLGKSVCTDPEGNVIFTGYYESPFLNFGGYPVINANVGFNDAFVARYDPDGNALGAIGIGGPGHEYGMGVATSPEGELYSTGYFGSYTLDFSGIVITNSGSFDIFLAKMPLAALNSIQSIGENVEVKLYPNPAHDQINVLSKGRTEIRVYDLASRKILERQFTDMTSIDITEIPAGLYLYELKRNGNVVKGKFVRE